MERLTRKSQSSDMVWFVDHENSNMNLEPCEMNPHHNRLAIQKLAEYEDAEEQGLIWRLPCKVGDTVYVVKNNTDACDECNCFEEGYYGHEDYCTNKEIDDADERFYPQYSDKPICPKQFMEIFVKKATLDWTFNSRQQFGKTIFLTIEEAEAALEKMKVQ